MITASTPTNTPVPEGELIVNGGFEGSASPWTLNGHATWDNGPTPHSGAGYLTLGNLVSTKGFAYQQITVPGVTALGLTFWLNVTCNETTTTTANDVLYVEIRNTAGNLVQTLATFSNLHRGSQDTYFHRGPYKVTPFGGQTIRIQSRVTGNASLPTAFLVAKTR